MSDTQWQELDGEPTTVLEKGRKYTELAEAIARSVSTLQQIVDDTENKAESMEKTKKLAGEVREDIDKARERYSYTGEALTTYGTALRAAKDEADPAAVRLRTLRAELETAQATASNAENGVDDLPKDASEADKDDATRAQTNANGAVNDLQRQITQAESEWNAGHGDKESAASTAASKIEEVVSGDKVNGLEDTWKDDLRNIAKGVYKVFKIICDIAGVLAIFLSWVPILGQVLLALAAIGAILTIIESIVKYKQGDIGFGAMLLGVGLGVMGLFGGKAIGSVAKYAKARSVVQTSRTLGSQASKLKFGTAVLKSSRKTMAMSKGKNMMDVLKSPFVRTAGDKAVAGMVKNGLYKNAFKSWQGAKFPMPYKDGAMRFAMGNDDVVGMMKHFSQSGLRIDGVTSAAQGIASVGAVFNQTANLANNAAKLGTGIGGGDGWGAYSGANGLGTSGAGGSWGKITGLPSNVNNAVTGISDVSGHDGYVAGKW